jgi:hypothetical protein
LVDLKVGDKVYFVHSDKRRGPHQWLTVQGIGRKWVQLDGRYRMDKKSWWVDGGQYVSPGRCYPTKEEYDAEAARQAAWRRFWCSLEHRYTAPDGVTVEQIEAAIAALGIGA